MNPTSTGVKLHNFNSLYDQGPLVKELSGPFNGYPRSNSQSSSDNKYVWNWTLLVTGHSRYALRKHLVCPVLTQSVNELNTTVLLRTQTMDTVVIITAYCAFRYEWGKNHKLSVYRPSGLVDPVEVIGRMFKFVNKKNRRAFLVRWSPVKSFPHTVFHPCDRFY